MKTDMYGLRTKQLRRADRVPMFPASGLKLGTTWESFLPNEFPAPWRLCVEFGLAHCVHRTNSNANPFKYSVSGIIGMIGWSGDCA